MGGPDNWARMQILALDTPDQDGNTHRICLAFDTKVYPEGHEYESLAPNENDIKTGAALRWPITATNWASFLIIPGWTAGCGRFYPAGDQAGKAQRAGN